MLSDIMQCKIVFWICYKFLCYYFYSNNTVGIMCHVFVTICNLTYLQVLLSTYNSHYINIPLYVCGLIVITNDGYHCLHAHVVENCLLL